MAGNKKTVKPNAKPAARKRAGAKSAPPKSVQRPDKRNVARDPTRPENARLAAQLRAALDRQTATSEILRIVSGSPTDVQPVFDAIVLAAVRLFRRDLAFILSCDATTYWPVATTVPQGLRAPPDPAPVAIDTEANFPSRVIVTRKNLHLPDWSAVKLPDYERMIHKRLGINSALYLPLLREGKCIGVLGIAGKRAGIFGASEIALAESFRDQALIAIENTRLFNETKEALERQTVTADILKVIASSPSDTTPVFEAIATSANRLLGGFSAAVFRFLDGNVHLAAFTPVSPAADAALKADFPTPVDEFEAFRLAQQGKPFPIPDTEEIPHPPIKEIARLHGFRSMLFVPLMNGGVLIGIISVTRLKPGPFSPNHIQLLQTFADQAVIAIENTRLFNETREALERQTATADILKVIASSPSDVQPVFDVIVEHAVRLCGGRMGRVYRYDDGMIHMVAGQGLSVPGLSKVQEVYPRPAADDTTAGQAIRSRRPNFVIDIKTDASVPPLSRQMIEALGTRSQVTVPMLRSGDPIGAITVGWTEPGAWGDQQVALLETFADQAVIAIENVRLFNETKEALERQTATADILKVIASSPSDVQPVFEKIVDSAARLFEPCAATIVTLRDEEMHWNATAALRPDFDVERARSVYPMPFAPDRFPSARAIAERRIVEILDANAPDTPDVTRRAAAIAGFRSVTFVPLINDSRGIGTIILTHPLAGFRLSERQLALVQTFADQAVIAIENVRLFNETREALERQTATADILKVIAGSPSDVQPVFEAIATSANRLIGGFSGTVWRIIDGALHLMAFTPTTAAADKILKASFPSPVANFPLLELVYEGKVAQVADTEAISDVRLAGIARARGFRSVIWTPLMSDGTPIGVIGVTRLQPGSFASHHVQLLQTFADQAVIAIQNARLFNETKEALERQTATADILKVIASSPSDVQPVFEAIAERSKRLVDALSTTVFRLEDGVMHLRAFTTTTPEADATLKAMFPAPLSDFSWGDAIGHGGIYRVVDTEQEIEGMRELARQRGYRSMLFVPLLRDGTPIGVIAVTRVEPGPFVEHHVQLLQTFADQAVIAIENVRLFDEVQARTEDLRESLRQQTATADVLKVISRSTFDLQAVLDTLIQSAAQLCDANSAHVYLREGETYKIAACSGFSKEYEEFLKQRAIAPGRGTLVGRTAEEGRIVRIPDILLDREYDYHAAQKLGGFRTMLGVPMLRDGAPIGVLGMTRSEVRPFTDKQIELVTTFADQAVIAIENVRLFEQVQSKTRDLTEALQFQTATSDVLKVISSSPDALQPVLDVIVETSRELCGSDASTIYLLRNDKFHVAAQSGIITPHMERLRNNPQSIDQPGSVLARVARERHTLHFPNIVDDPEMKDGIAALGGPRALLVAPLMREGQVIGAIVLRQSHLVPFTPPQIEVIETFADQAVIAISNVNLFEQVQARTRELSKSLDDLRTAQDRLVQTEKLASLGQLTAGIAHEIKNPLNFVNNFSALSAELVDELNDALKPVTLSGATRKEVDDLTRTLKGNLEKVVQHGKRADSIVKNMLLHSREGSGEHRPADINALLDESLNLAYHGARAEKSEFNITLQRDFDARAGMVELFPQEITRAFLNLISNGFYAAAKRKTEIGHSGFDPVLSATTRNLGDAVEIRIRDNGTGIPAEVKEKMFNPFFTTKPAGEGTGLGLSMSHDIIVKQHGGTVDVETEPGQFTEFRIVLPRTSNLQEKKRGQS